MIFLDNASTTRPLDNVIDAMSFSMKNFYGNPSSFHKLGMESEKLIRNTKSKIFEILHCKSGEIYFTSGGTESNNLAIFGSINPKSVKNILSSSIEHASVYNCMKKLKNIGVKINYLSPIFERSDLKLDDLITQDIGFISIMHVNNELGLKFPLEEIAKIRKLKCPDAIFHVDAVQSFGKFDIDVEKLRIDLLSISSHKIHGPKGLGCIYSSKRVKLNPILFGGKQQSGIRPGTEPVELINGFNTALNLCNINERYNYVKELNLYTREKLSKIDGIVINSPLCSSPYILNISVLGIKSETMLNYLSENDIFVSSSSACTGNVKSRVLTEMKFPDNIIDSAIRISFSIFNSKSDIDSLINHIILAKKKLIISKEI